MTTIFDGLIAVHYGFIDLDAEGGEFVDLRDARRGQTNGLCGAAAPGRLSMVTGLHTGGVPLVVEWSESAPVLDDWEDVVEVSVELPATRLVLSAFETFVNIEVPQAGWHRARWSADKMDAGKELDTPDEDEDAPDSYRLQLWPAPAEPDRIVRQTSEIAAYWHGTPSS